MKYINKVILIGNVCSDVYFAGDGQKPRATFRLATNRSWKNKEGEKESTAEYHDICVWGAAAELVNESVKQGKLLYVEGYLKTRAIEKDGEKQYRTEVVSETFIMLDKKTDIPEGGIDG